MNKTLTRNDFTFIERLDKIADKYLELQKEQVTLNKHNVKYYHMHNKIKNYINEIKEEMKLKALQKIIDD